MKFSLVIPTYNRPDDLKKCLDSVLAQRRLPDEVLLIDDGNLDKKMVTWCQQEFSARGADFVYRPKDHRREERGLSESKNIALDLAREEIIFIIDDDVVLEEDYCQHIMAAWEDNETEPKLIGIGGVIKNNRRRSGGEKLFHAFFGLGSRWSWDVNGAAFQVWDDAVRVRQKAYYMHGGASSYRRSLAQTIRFSVFVGGRTSLEDVDFCLEAKLRGYHMMIEPASRLEHFPSAVSREDYYLIGLKEGNNRREIFFHHYPRAGFRRRFWFYWANIGWILRQFLSGQFIKGVGMARGAVVGFKK